LDGTNLLNLPKPLKAAVVNMKTRIRAKFQKKKTPSLKEGTPTSLHHGPSRTMMMMTLTMMTTMMTMNLPTMMRMDKKDDDDNDE
jgi:hypothetical protein